MQVASSKAVHPLGWQRLIRFFEKGQPKPKFLWGEPILPPGETRINRATHAWVLQLTNNYVATRTEQIAEIDRFAKLPSGSTIRCLGLNYRPHAEEAKLPIPQYPILFYKPQSAISSPFRKILIPSVALDSPTIDYECELVVVIRNTCKDVAEDKALDYVLGYAVGNDLSHRDWQLQLGGGQWNFGKSFDGFAPYGPGIVRPEALGNKDPGQCTKPSTGLKIWTKVNGETVQEGWTGDMIFNVARTIAFLSQGTTLSAGSLIFMGTPAGVGMSRNPPRWLKNGDIVEVGLEGIGSCINTIEFAKSEKDV